MREDRGLQRQVGLPVMGVSGKPRYRSLQARAIPDQVCRLDLGASESICIEARHIFHLEVDGLTRQARQAVFGLWTRRISSALASSAITSRPIAGTLWRMRAAGVTRS